MTTQKAVGDILKKLICDNGKLVIEVPITAEKVEILKNTILQNPIFEGVSLPSITDEIILKIAAGGSQCQTAIDGLVKDVEGTSLKENFNTLATDPNLIDGVVENIEDEIILDKYFNEDDFEDDNPCLSTLDYYRGLKDGFSGSWTDLWEAIKSLKELETYKNLFEGVKVLTCPPPCPDAEIAIKQAKMIEKLIEWLNSSAGTPDCYEDGRRTGKVFTDLLAGEGIAAASKRGLKLLAKAAEKAKINKVVEMGLASIRGELIASFKLETSISASGAFDETLLLKAKKWQGTRGYPGVDDWTIVVIPKGTKLYGGLPGQSQFYSVEKALIDVNYNKVNYWKNLQVSPHPQYGYRTKIGEYAVKSTVKVAISKTLANPQHGIGGSWQIFVDDFMNNLDLKKEINLK